MNLDNRPVVIMDIDGTLSDASHRLHLLPRNFHFDTIDQKNEAWEAFLAAARADKPITEIVALSNALYDAGYKIYLVTGRQGTQRDMTKAWLAEHEIIYNELHMRPAGDHRPDTVVKAEILQSFRETGETILFAVEDRASVTAMWRENGVRCLQVCEGNY